MLTPYLHLLSVCTMSGELLLYSNRVDIVAITTSTVFPNLLRHDCRANTCGAGADLVKRVLPSILLPNHYMSHKPFSALKLFQEMWSVPNTSFFPLIITSASILEVKHCSGCGIDRQEDTRLLILRM